MFLGRLGGGGERKVGIVQRPCPRLSFPISCVRPPCRSAIFREEREKGEYRVSANGKLKSNGGGERTFTLGLQGTHGHPVSQWRESGREEKYMSVIL